MTQTPVRSLICRLALPTMVSMMITSIYNMADTFFVSQIGTSAAGAVGIAFSLMAIIQAVGFTMGMGSASFVSRLLGQKNPEYAGKVAATGFVSALILGGIMGLLGLIFLNPLVYALGATDTIAPYARDYVRFILLGTPYMAAALVLNNQLRMQGNAFYAMIGIGAGGVLNILLDPIFIYGLDLGTAGAALATIISQFVSFCILLHNSGVGGTIKIRLRNFTPCMEIYREIFNGGMPSFWRQALGSLATICMNFGAAPFGDAAIAAMSIVTRVFQFASSAMIGFGQGFQPVCAFNFGAKRYDRVLEGFWFCVKTSAAVLTLIGIAGFFFAPEVMMLFRREDAAVIAVGSLAMRLQAVTFPLSGWVVMTNMFLQNIGRGTKASVVAMSRQGLFFLPAILLLPLFLGLTGVQLSQPVADVLSFLLAVPLCIGVLRELQVMQEAEALHPSEGEPVY